MNHRYVVIEGNIGAGKTSLAKKLALEFSGRLVLEEFADNPFLAKFYDNPERYAFPLELSFIAERFSQLSREVVMPDLFAQPVFSDYIINKSQIFARNNLQDDEYELFQKLFSLIQPQFPKPDLLIYLHVEVEQLQRNIVKRGRDYEKSISPVYLRQIAERYHEFIRQNEQLRIIVVDTTYIDFLENEDHYKKMRSLLELELTAGVHRLGILHDS